MCAQKYEFFPILVTLAALFRAAGAAGGGIAPAVAAAAPGRFAAEIIAESAP